MNPASVHIAHATLPLDYSPLPHVWLRSPLTSCPPLLPYSNNFRFPLIQTAVWSKTFRGKAPPDAIDLISLMLKYDPKARILPLDALAHPFFDPLRLANAGAASVSGLSKDIVLPPTLFAFTDEELRTMQKRGTLLKIVPPHLLPTLQMPTTTDTQ